MNAARKAQDKDRTLVLGTIWQSQEPRDRAGPAPGDEEVVEVAWKASSSGAKRRAVHQGEPPELARVEAQIRVLEEFLPRQSGDPRRRAR
jgi:hypothetical protein